MGDYVGGWVFLDGFVLACELFGVISCFSRFGCGSAHTLLLAARVAILKNKYDQ